MDGLKKIILKTIEDHVWRTVDADVQDTVYEHLEAEAMAGAIAERLRLFALSYAPSSDMIDPKLPASYVSCGKCGRPFGGWRGAMGDGRTDASVSRRGAKIILLDEC